MNVLFRVALASLLLLFAIPALGSDAPAAEPVPPWLERLRGWEPPPPGAPLPPLTEPLGRRFVRRTTPALILMPAAPLIGVVGLMFGENVLIGPLAGQSLGAGAGIGGAIALERAAIDLRLRGAPIPTGAGRLGFVMLGLGTLGMATSAAFVISDPDKMELFDAAAGIAIGSGVLTLTATIPYAVQIGIVRRAYRSLPHDAPAPRASLWIAPTIDPVGRTIGVTGTF